MTRRTSGFTLIEVLVSIVVLGIVLSLSAGLLTALSGNRASGTRVTVAQATTAWLENVSNIWALPGQFGNVALLPPVPAVEGHTWSVQVCAVTNAVSGATSCGTAKSSGTPTFPSGTTGPTIVRLNLGYTQTSTNKTTWTSMELSNL